MALVTDQMPTFLEATMMCYALKIRIHRSQSQREVSLLLPEAQPVASWMQVTQP